MSQEEANPLLRFLAVLAVTIVVSTPFAVFLFVMGLVVAESVIYPTASLATSVIAALVASWAANSLAGDGQRTGFNAVVMRNLAWAVLPATASLLIASSVDRTVWLVSIVLLYLCFTAGLLALRHRATEGSTGHQVKLTVAWLLGTVLGVGLVSSVASLLGLTGA